MKPAALVEPSLSRIAHDLRGPLMPLRTAAWLLCHEHEARERVLELADIVDRQSLRLARLLDELNDWGSLTEGKTGARREPVEVTLAVDMAVGGFRDCDVEPRIAEEAASFPLHADPHGFGQLLRTLIEHAIHRAPHVPPVLTLEVASGRLHVRVRDQGAPLDAASRDALLTRPQAVPFDDGLGLRLLMARKIAEVHGGSLEIDEAVDDGLALVCALPGAGTGIDPEQSHDASVGSA